MTAGSWEVEGCMKPVMNEFLAAARQIVMEAGTKAKGRPRLREVHHWKAHGDFVTNGDLLVQDHVISSLKKRFPDHGFESEESEPENPQAEYVWVLDPIDGTKYYAKDVPLYAVSLALRRDRQYVLGVVFIPEMARLYCAAAGVGATLNDKPIKCSSVGRLINASIYMEIPSVEAPLDEQREAIGKMATLIQRSYRVRVIGVASIGLCFCAAGGFDVYAHWGSFRKDCDTAAGQVIMRQAGGEFIVVGQHIVAGPETLCSQVRKAVGL